MWKRSVKGEFKYKINMVGCGQGVNIWSHFGSKSCLKLLDVIIPSHLSCIYLAGSCLCKRLLGSKGWTINFQVKLMIISHTAVDIVTVLGTFKWKGLVLVAVYMNFSDSEQHCTHVLRPKLSGEKWLLEWWLALKISIL